MAKKWPTWPNLGPKMEPKAYKNLQKSMQKLIKKSMPVKAIFLSDFDGFGDKKWKQTGTQIDKKLMPAAKSENLMNRAPAVAGARFLWFWGSKLGP